jgi:predicted transcriptional regulator
MAEAVDQLQQLGFSAYEAQAYVTLVQRSPLTGYELAKASGLPRANIYSVLQKLEERTAVVRIETEAGIRYAAVPPAELLHRLANRFEERLEATRRVLEELSSLPPYDYVCNLQGYSALLQHTRTLIDAAEKHLLVALWAPEASALSEALAGAADREVEIITLCLAGCPNQCPNCRGQIYRYHVAPESNARWLVLVADDREVLAGEISQDQAALAVRTGQRLLVDLASWYIRHSITLPAILTDLGEQLEPQLPPETRASLMALRASGQPGSWLEDLRRLIGHGKG